MHGGGLLVVLFLRLIDWLFINDFFWDYFIAIFQKFISLLNSSYSIKLYPLILITVIIILIWYGYKRLKNRTITEHITLNIDSDPDWKTYTKDVFDGIQYRWEYLFEHSNKKYRITNINPYCNDCSCLLVQGNCPNCKASYGTTWGSEYILKQSGEVEALIIHRIENNLYKK